MIILKSFSDLQDELSNKNYRLIPEVNKFILSAIEKKETTITIPIDQLTTDDSEVEFIKEKLVEANYIIDDGCLGVIFADVPKKVKLSFCPFFKLKNNELIPAEYVLVSGGIDLSSMELLTDTFFEIFSRKLNLSIEKFHENPNKSYGFEIRINDVFSEFLNQNWETPVVEKFVKTYQKMNTNNNLSLIDLAKLAHPLLIIKIKKQFKLLEYPFSEQIKPDQFSFNFTLNSSNVLNLNDED